MKTKTHLIVSGLFFTVVLFLWPVLMSVSQPEGNITEQLGWISKNLTVHRMMFTVAFLISPALVYMMISQLEATAKTGKINMRTGLVFLTCYVVLVSIAYASQAALVPMLIKNGLPDQAATWYFNSSYSITYFVDQMGYCFWGAGAIILFHRLIFEPGMIKYISIIYVISAILSILAFTGLMINNLVLQSMTLYSGLLLAPVGILTVIWACREKNI